MILLVSGATATLRRHLDSPFLGHLLVPAAGNSMREVLATGLPWAADNGAFTGFDAAGFTTLLGRIAGKPGCLFVACPDVVGDAAATLALFDVWQPVMQALGVPVALVGQDGLEKLEVPWGRMAALFLGGSTDWKLGEAAAGLAHEAKARGVWVHVGRVNTRQRFRHAFAIGSDSVDGSAFSRWPGHHVPRGLAWLSELHGVERPPPGEAARKGRSLPVARRKAGEWFDLPGWAVEKAQRTPRQCHLWARYLPEPQDCPHCGANRLLARGPRRHGGKTQRIADVPRLGRPLVVWVRRSRHRCLGCGHTFFQPLPDLAAGRRLTQRLADYVASQAATHSLRSVAREVGLAERTVREIARTNSAAAIGRGR